jgi:hypothetical protein
MKRSSGSPASKQTRLVARQRLYRRHALVWQRDRICVDDGGTDWKRDEDVESSDVARRWVSRVGVRHRLDRRRGGAPHNHHRISHARSTPWRLRRSGGRDVVVLDGGSPLGARRHGSTIVISGSPPGQFLG